MGNCTSFASSEVKEDNDTHDNVLLMDETVHSNGCPKLVSIYSQQGTKEKNQDSALFYQGFGTEEQSFCGVFDGHGMNGHIVSKLVRNRLPGLILRQQKAFADEDYEETSSGEPVSSSEWRRACVSAFKVMDKEIKREKNLDCSWSGTTAVTIIMQGKDLIISNLGDSRAILGTISRNDELTAVQLTTDLKPDLPKLLQLGAVVISSDIPEPSIDDLADQVVEVLNFFGLGVVMCLGVTAGAYVLTLFAIKYRQRVLGLVLVSPICRDPSWTEWFYNKVSLSAFALLFSELVQYNQTQVDNIAELERRLENAGYAVGTRVLELLCHRDKLRTFFIRNGLPVLFKEGPAAYKAYYLRQMKTWNTSAGKQRELSKILDEWAAYIRRKCGNKQLSSSIYLNEVKPFLEQYAKRSPQNQALIGSAGNFVKAEDFSHY